MNLRELYLEVLYHLENHNQHALAAIMSWVMGMSEHFAIVSDYWELGIQRLENSTVWVRNLDRHTSKWVWVEYRVRLVVEPTGVTKEKEF